MTFIVIDIYLKFEYKLGISETGHVWYMYAQAIINGSTKVRYPRLEIRPKRNFSSTLSLNFNRPKTFERASNAVNLRASEQKTNTNH